MNDLHFLTDCWSKSKRPPTSLDDSSLVAPAGDRPEGVAVAQPDSNRRRDVKMIDLSSPATLPAPSGYSHVASVPAPSRFVWTSGQVPITAQGEAAPADDWEAQTRLAMQNVAAALEAGDATWDDVIKLTIFVTDTSALPTVRAVRDEFINVKRPPTSSLVQVAGLFRPDILIEIEAVAAIHAHG